MKHRLIKPQQLSPRALERFIRKARKYDQLASAIDMLNREARPAMELDANQSGDARDTVGEAYARGWLEYPTALVAAMHEIAAMRDDEI